MTKKLLLFALMAFTSLASAQTLRSNQTFCRLGQNAYIIENGDSFAVNQNRLVVKPKGNVVLSKDIKQIRTSKLGYIRIEVPQGISVENYAKEMENSGMFEYINYCAECK